MVYFFRSRGLGQLVRARNIHTIGDLSSLSENDIHSLPIRSPKVDTVRKVLNKFGQNLQTSKAKLWNSPKVVSEIKDKLGMGFIKYMMQVFPTEYPFTVY